ncbi:apoptosis-resistant E3 ubiquitin protein ligase 1-like isoform X3 [Sinocyclocheilus anshuiensis]|uniref:apoptosis-resistant E3 ubiquitin protein ligase 1-like isoform X3 n=1 Tax=Sinocyclocheilus anshuiensis TaxID=1608454 RepID=UPI0007B8C171|nr:PREDICTED: apoptosis-resistant E3 ubiquitin protein ligase 1-like isoform X3 [Sinocyclocheilus anshuiensis]
MDRLFLLTFVLCSISWIFFWEVRWKKGKESQIEEWLQRHSLSKYKYLFEDVQTLEELSLCVLSRLEEVVKEKHHWREITEAQVQLLRDFAFQEWLCSQSLEHYYHTLKTLGCTTLDDLAQFDSQLQLSLAAWGYYYEDYIKLSTGVRVLQASKGSRDQDYEIQLVHSLAERRLNEKWSFGTVVPSKTKIAYHFSTLVLTYGQQHTLQIEPRDEYGNPTSNSVSLVDEVNYNMHIHPLGTVDEESSDDCYSTSVSLNKPQCQVLMRLTFRKKGCFRACISYRDQPLSNGEFDIIVLSENEKNCVEKNVSTPGISIYFEAYLYSMGTYSSCPWQFLASSQLALQRRPSMADDEEEHDSPVEGQSEKVKKPKKVYCYISPKQFSVKEFYLKIIPWRLFTFRVCPGTKFTYHGPDPVHKYLTLVVDDGIQPPVELSCKDRNIMAATFIRFLHKNIGGSETFQDKVNFFQRELRHIHSKRPRTKTCLKVSRHSLLESSLKATRNFSVSDWSKNFEVVFQDEEALDWGGPRREWFELICKALFDTNNQLFTRFSDNNQGLVHPNADRPPHQRVKMYEFAGRVVGKCLYESALGGAYKQLVRARFTRSFLAQIIGLRMNYKYFETDDEEFYKTKVCFILNNDVSEMDLVFAEEKYSKSGHLEKVVELISGGAQIAVTNENKIHYLNLLAQYRLASQVRDEVEHFLKGLNELVPENLLAIFDENELELLMCGTGDINVQDFKAHTVIVGGSWHFREKVMKWFWAVVSSFTQEELARLLQFTTGSSQLPPGGFNTLCPSFQIIAAPTHSTLPTAHTCFNQLCLPTYDSYEELHKLLKLAISEGSEGFGML